MSSKLPWYLEDINFLGDSARLNNAKKIKAALHYAALDEAKVWQMLLEASMNLVDWEAFIKAVKKSIQDAKVLTAIVVLTSSILCRNIIESKCTTKMTWESIPGHFIKFLPF